MTETEYRDRLITIHRIGNLDILSVKDVAELMQYSVDYVTQLARKGKLTYFKTIEGKRMFFRKKDIIDYMTSDRFASDEQLMREAIEYCARKPLNLKSKRKP